MNIVTLVGMLSASNAVALSVWLVVDSPPTAWAVGLQAAIGGTLWVVGMLGDLAIQHARRL